MKNELLNLWDTCPVCGVHQKQKSRAMCFGCETKLKAKQRREERRKELHREEMLQKQRERRAAMKEAKAS